MNRKNILKQISILLLIQSPIFIYSQKDSCSHSKNFVIVNHEISILFSGGYFTEGPAANINGDVYFSDITFTSETKDQFGHIWCYSEKNDTTILFKSPSNMSNGLIIDNEGNLIIAEGADRGGRRITSINLKNGESQILADTYGSKRLNSPNDLACDKNGNIYFTDPRYVGEESIEQPIMGVYRLSPDGTLSLLIYNISMPNGIAISPNKKRLYVGCFDESPENNRNILSGMFIASYLFNGDSSVSFEKIIVEYETPVGPDGIETDQYGNLYVAVRDEDDPHIAVYCSEGDLLTKIPIPEVPSNICFGKGNYSNRLYVTAGKSLYEIILSIENKSK